MNKTTFVFGAPPESEEGKFVKFFSRLSLSLLLSLFLFIVIIIAYLVILFLSGQTKLSEQNIKAQTEAIKNEINSTSSLKELLKLIQDTNKRIKLADLALETHTDGGWIVYFLEKYTIDGVYLKRAKFSSERPKLAPVIKEEFDNLKKELSDFVTMITSQSIADQIKNNILSRFEKTSGFPTRNIIIALNATLNEFKDRQKFPLESAAAREKADQLSKISDSLSQKLSQGETLIIEGEAADFSIAASQIVSYKDALRHDFMDKDEKTVLNIAVSKLNFTQDGKVSFKMDLTLNPNYLLAKK